MGFAAQVQNNQTGGGKSGPSPSSGAIDPSPKDGSSGHIPFESQWFMRVLWLLVKKVKSW